MTAPDRIWLAPNRVYMDPWIVVEVVHQGDAKAVEYVRADLVDPAAIREAALREAGKTVLHDIDELVANSEGVAGLHMNGEVAEWSSLMDGGAFGAWLSSVEGLRAALTTEADNG